MHLRPEELSKNVPEISLEGNFVALAFASTALEDNHFCPCLTNWAIRVFFCNFDWGPAYGSR